MSWRAMSSESALNSERVASSSMNCRNLRRKARDARSRLTSMPIWSSLLNDPLNWCLHVTKKSILEYTCWFCSSPRIRVKRCISWAHVLASEVPISSLALVKFASFEVLGIHFIVSSSWVCFFGTRVTSVPRSAEISTKNLPYGSCTSCSACFMLFTPWADCFTVAMLEESLRCVSCSFLHALNNSIIGILSNCFMRSLEASNADV